MRPLVIADASGRKWSTKPGHPLTVAMIQSEQFYGRETTEAVFTALLNCDVTAGQLARLRKALGECVHVNIATLMMVDLAEFNSGPMRELLARFQDTAARL